MSISAKKRIIKKIDNAHLVWFEESNSWIQFEEPAWFVYRKFGSGAQTTDISRKFAGRYGLNLVKSLVFVKDIISEVRKLSTATFHPEEILSSEQIESLQIFFSTRKYYIKQNIVEISFGSRFLDYIIHQSLAHLETKKISRPHFRIETFSLATSHILKIGSRAWVEDDANMLKRRLFIEISGLLYGKSDQDWLSFVHGSAVSNESETIILSTASGSGKSTLAALLCSQGLKFVSDDYVPIDRRFCKAYPFPAALSVKDGAYPILLPFYKQLQNAEIFHFKGSRKTIRYLSFPQDGNFFKPLPVKNIVFVRYDPTKPFFFRKVPALEALRRYNEEAWVSPLPVNARKFINWFLRLNCYELEYSDNNMAIREIKGLFKKI